MRTSLFLVGALLTGGAVCFLIAAFTPPPFSSWSVPPEEMLTGIAQGRGRWQLLTWLFAVGTGLTIPGVAALAGLLDQPRALLSAALAAFIAGSTLWLAGLAFRLTVTVAVAGRGNVPDWYGPAWSWTGAMLYGFALLGGLAMIGCGLAVIGSTVLPGWTGWLAVVIGGFVLGLFAVTRDVPPFLLYLPTLIFGVTALIRFVQEPA